MTFSYSGDNASVTGGSTTVTTYPDGTGSGEPTEVTTYDYSSNVLMSETTGVGTASAATEGFARDPDSLQPLTTTDANDNTTIDTYNTAGDTLTTTDAVGNTTQNAYNSLNQAWCTVDGADYANGVRCPQTPPASTPAPGTSDPDLGMTISFYDASDQLIATTDALGNTTTYSYTQGISGVPIGLQYCSVDPVSYQKGIACPGYGAPHVTGTTTETFDSAGDKTSSTDADGNTTTYAYADPSNPGLVSSQTDPDGTVTSYTYNGEGEVTSQVESFGSYPAKTLYAYDSYGRKYCEVDPAAAAAGIACPSSPPSSPPTPGSDPYLGATITSYDADGRVVQSTNPLGGIAYTAYDQAGEQFCSVAPEEAAVGVTCPASAPSSPPTVGDDPYLGATITTYDPDGRVVQTTNPLGGITLTSYDADGNPVQTTVESNNDSADPEVVTENYYDADNRVTKTIVGYGSPDPSTTLTSYDPNGDVYCSVSANAFAAGTYQCPQWQDSWITEPPSPTTLYSASPSLTQAEGVTSTFYDANGDQLQSTNPDAETQVSAYDPDGRTYCTADATNVSAWLSANSGGSYPYLCPGTSPQSPPAQGSDPGYVTTIFDAAGHMLSSTDQVGDTTTTTYDPAGHVLTTTDPRGALTTNCYYYESGAGGCAATAPAGGGSGDDLYSTTTPATAANPSGETTTYTYYPGEKTYLTTTPAGVTTDSYDVMGDLGGVSYSNTANGYSTPANVAYTYNEDGSKATMTDAQGTTTYTYDAMGDLSSQALAVASGSGLSNTTTSYGYFSTGVLSSVTYPSYSGHSSPKVTFTYDALGNMTSETDWLGNTVAFAHDGDGNLVSQDNDVSASNPSGTSSTTFSYDYADQNTQVSSTLAQSCGGQETLTQSFLGTGGSRNPDDQLTGYTDGYSGSCSGQGSYERNYSYDPSGRVVYQGSSAQGSSSNNFSYDPSGDPTTISSHDASGNLDTYTQAFDSAGEVTSQTPVTGSMGTRTTYGYDALGDQNQAASASGTTTYGFDQAGQMTSATSPSGSTEYLYSGAGLEAATEPVGTAPGPPSYVDASYPFEALSCASPTFCMAADNDGNVFTYNGTAWSSPTQVDGDNTLDSVSCVSSSFCVTVDNDGNALTYNGTSWSSPTQIDGTKLLDSVSCASATFCMAVDAKGDAIAYNGTGWSAPKSIDSTKKLLSVSCPTAGFCAVIDAQDNALTYNGTSWSPAKSVEPDDTLVALSCASATFCMAVDNAGHAITYNGTTWSSPSSIDGNNTLESVSCSSSSSCVAVDNDGNALTYNGTGWSAAKSIDSTRKLTGVSCPTAGFCAAVDSAGDAITYGSTEWSVAQIDASNTLESVSCASSTFCVAVDNKGNALTYNGTSWSAAQPIDGSNTLESVSCASPSFCVAVDNKGNAVVYNGTGWSAPKSIDSTRKLLSVSCPTAGFCAAIDFQDNALTYNGTLWSVAKSVEPDDTLVALSCVSSTFCVSVDNAGHAITYNGTSWSAPASVDGDDTLDSVSCVSSSFCEAVDNDGNALTYNGTGWSAPTQMDENNTLDSVSCVSSSFCAAVDSKGNVVTFNGTSWSDTSSVDSTRKITSISCFTTDSCVAVDSKGYATVYGLVPTSAPSQFTWDTNGSLPLVLSDGTNDYIYGPGTTPVEEVSLSNSTPTYMTYTASDSIWLTTNGVGGETGFWGYDAFGNLAFGTPSSPFGYAGQYLDPSTGLSNMRARWYEPQTGNFTTRDPAFASTDTAYDYAEGDPVDVSDPSGLRPKQLSHAKLAALAQVAYNLSFLPDGLDGFTTAQLGAILWSIIPANCKGCSRNTSVGADYPYDEAVGAEGNLLQWLCLTRGLTPGGCYPPNPNPSINWKAAAVTALALTAVVTGGLAIGADGLAYVALAFTAETTALASAGWDIVPCTHGNVAACVGFGLDIISAGVGFGALAGVTGFSGQLVSYGGWAVGISGAEADIFSLETAGASPSSTGGTCINGIVPTGTNIPVPDPGLKPI
jgi:RHS repeat-associated protein